MAATQPIIVTTSTTIRLDQVFVAQKDDYIVIAAEVQVEAQWDLATDTGFTAIIWTTGLRVPDQHQLGTDWVEIPIPYIRPAASTALYLRCYVRTDTPTLSVAADYITLTTEAAALTAANWEAAQ